MGIDEYQRIRQACLCGPRVTTLIKHFEEIARGDIQVPKTVPVGDTQYLVKFQDLNDYHDVLIRNMGPFYRHYVASVPYLIGCGPLPSNAPR